MPTETNHVRTKARIPSTSKVARRRKIVKAEVCRGEVLWCLGVAEDAWLQRAGAERFWSLCAPSAAKLERTAAVVMMIEALVRGISR